MVAQALYFGLLALLLIAVAFSSHANLEGKPHTFFSFCPLPSRAPGGSCLCARPLKRESGCALMHTHISSWHLWLWWKAMFWLLELVFAFRSVLSVCFMAWRREAVHPHSQHEWWRAPLLLPLAKGFLCSDIQSQNPNVYGVCGLARPSPVPRKQIHQRDCCRAAMCINSIYQIINFGSWEKGWP